MNITPAAVSELIRKRRSIFPKTYNDKPISKEIIDEVLENANWAPTHKFTEPWRFRVIMGKGLERLANYLSTFYRNNTPEESFSERKYTKLKTKPMQATCIIAICMKRDEEERIPEWEEIAATAMAVQNMWLCCTELGIGSYWSSPGLIKYMGEFFDFNEGEKCLGIFYLGNYDMELPEVTRQPIADKVVWYE